MLYYQKSKDYVLKALHSNESGLSTAEVDRRLKIHGPNRLSIKSHSFWRKMTEPFRSVFMLVLFIAIIVSSLHKEYVDAGIIGAIIAITAIIYYVQSFATERVLRALKKQNNTSVEVVRDGKILKVDSDELVPGDIISLGEGDKIPADARLISVSGLRTDESILSGESEPITKQTEVLQGNKDVYEIKNMIFQGSFVVSGECRAVITATGNKTEFGQIAALAGTESPGSSPIQQKIDTLITQIVAIVGAMAAIAFTLSMIRGIELTESIKFVIAMSVSAVPESLPVAITVILVFGMRRMAKRKALVRTMNSLESIGAITTIATDKTGTLTENRLSVQATWAPRYKQDFESQIHKTINYSHRTTHDPLDISLRDYCKGELNTSSPAASLPFDLSVSMSGNIWKEKGDYRLYIKGAPENIIEKSVTSPSEVRRATQELHKLAESGYRVVAIARTDVEKPVEKFSELPNNLAFEFLGFVAVADTLRPEAEVSIRQALRAGVSVRMITGDHFETAFQIGRKLGMVADRNEVFDSRRMITMSDDELEKIVDTTKVFARVNPEHKYRLLQILKRNNITAMTGDGVNDVPALTKAHVGVAMGSGAHIAKEAGDIILLDDNFRSITEAMREGRVIINNIRRMIYYLLATNAGEVFTMLGALVIGLPLPIAPVHILWINLVTDTAMVIPLGLEPAEKHVMERKPHKIRAPILSRRILSRMTLVALGMAITALSLYIIYSNEHGHDYAQTIAFSSLVVMQWANAFNARSTGNSIFSRIKVWNGAFYIGLFVAVGLQALAIFGPLSGILGLERVAISDLIITGLISFASPIIIVELHKFWHNKVKR